MSFGGRRVLSNVDLAVPPGQVHALLGANGAGKSTLIKILSGHFRPESGSITIGGQSYPGWDSPQRATELGVRVVHQETPLFDTLSVAENIGLFLGYPTGAARRVRWRALRRRVTELLASFGIDLDPKLMCAELSASDRALVSIAIALGRDQQHPASILILDEASAAVPQAEADHFLRRVRALASAGTPVLMVTHRLVEVEAIADQVTVLNDGLSVYQGPPVPESDLINLMSSSADLAAVSHSDVAESLTALRARNVGDDAPVVLRVEHLSSARLRDVSFEVRAGECVGIVGGSDSGLEDLPLALVGATPVTGGRIFIDGAEVGPIDDPRDALKVGVALVPRDRLRQGGIASLSVAENILLPTVGEYWMKPRQAHVVVDGMIKEVDVRPPQRKLLLRELSGGNQQKLILGKWLACRPKVLILDDPTVGVDPGARRKLFDVVKSRAEHDGLAVILYSSEPEQLASVCHRVIAFAEGRVAATIEGEDLSYVSVARWAAA
jgi:ribose transport system ATP-binding protein